MTKIGKKLAAVLLAAAMILAFMPALGTQTAYADDTVISQIDLSYDAEIIDLNTAWTEGEVNYRVGYADNAAKVTSGGCVIDGLSLMTYSTSGYNGIGAGTSRVDTEKHYGIDYRLRLSNGYDWLPAAKEITDQTDITECTGLTVKVNGTEPTNVKIKYNESVKKLDVYVPIGTASTEPRVTGISIAGNDISVKKGESLTFTAVVSGTVSDKSVNWSVENKNSTNTVITPEGVLTVGNDEAVGEITVKATSVADSSKFATKTVTVLAESPYIDNVVISPKTAVVSPKGTLQFEAEVSGTQTDKSVSWSVSGNTDAGTTISDSGLLTVAAGEVASSITVTVTANQDATKMDSATVTIKPLEKISTIDLAYDDDIIKLNGIYTEGEVDQRVRWKDGAATVTSGGCVISERYLMWLPEYSMSGYYGIGDGTSQVDSAKKYGIAYKLRLSDGYDWLPAVKALADHGQTDITECYGLTVKVNDTERSDVKLLYNASGEYLYVFVPVEVKVIDIEDAAVTGISSKTYTGKAITQTPVVTLEGKTLTAGTDYTVSYENNTNAGTAKMTITGIENCIGDITEYFKINKAANPLAVSGKTAKVKYSKLKKKAQTLDVTKIINITNQINDSKTYTISSAKKGKKSFKKYFKIDTATGKVTVKKKLKKGTYKVTAKVTAAGNANYNASDMKTVTFKVKVK